LRKTVHLVAASGALALGTVALVKPALAPAEEGVASAPAEAEAQAAEASAERALAARRLAARQIKLIDRYRLETWRWQRLMGKPRTPTSHSARRSPNPEYRRWVLTLWRTRAVTARRQAHRPPRLTAWRCIQRYEGPWNDPHPPYYGGLQMDLHFQRLYGRELLRRKGTADRWTPLEQIWVAERAYRSGRGFYPWPNTARYCGLI
jgi:hypothetical protein